MKEKYKIITEVIIMYKYTSKVGRGNNNNVARVIIPKQIKMFLEVTPGDSIDWLTSIDENGVNITVKKSE